jgi:hypothetical protein
LPYSTILFGGNLPRFARAEFRLLFHCFLLYDGGATECACLLTNREMDDVNPA